MIKTILEKIERYPDVVFRKSELHGRFDELYQTGMFDYIQPDPHYETYPCKYSCSKSCPMEVIKINDQLYAICPEDSERDPLPLDRNSLHRYKFSINRFLEKLRSVNNISGDIQVLRKDCYYLGSKQYGNNRIGFIFLRNADSLSIAGLQNICDEKNLVIITILKKLNKLDLAGRNIVNVSLVESMDDDFRLEIDLHSLNIQEPINTKLTFLDQKAGGRSYYINLNSEKISVPYSEMVLLIYFAIKRKKADGWISQDDTDKEGITESENDDGHLRKLINRLEKSLKGRKDLIENDNEGRYRLAVSFDNIIIPDKHWLENKLSEILSRLDEYREKRAQQKEL